MPALLTLDPVRIDRERLAADLVEAGTRHWRRAWVSAYLQCVAFTVAGLALYGLSWGLHGDPAVVVSALAFVVAYALPFFRLIAFYLRHADQF